MRGSRVSSGCEPAPAPPDAAGIIASADPGPEREGGANLSPGRSVPSPPIRWPAGPPIHIARTALLRSGRPKGGPDLDRTPISGSEGLSRVPESLGGGVSWCSVLPRAAPGLLSACHHQRRYLPPLLCARPYSRLVKQPSPCPRQTALTHPESKGGEDKKTSKGTGTHPEQ